MDKYSNSEKLKFGDPDSFTTLYKETYPRMLGYSSLFIKDEKQREDLIQDCYENIWSNKEKIDTSKSVESLLFVMLRNKCLNHLKKEQTRNQISLTENNPVNEIQHLYQLDFTEKEGRSIEEELIISMKHAIDDLPEKRKQVFIECKINGRKQKEVAEAMGITIKAVEKHLSKAKEQIQKQLLNKYTTLSSIILILLS